MKSIEEISRAAAAPTWLFALGAAAGANGVGDDLRRPAYVGRDSNICQRRCRRIVAPRLGPSAPQSLPAAVLRGRPCRHRRGLAVRYDLSSSLRLVAVCPCMVLVPGPHFFNGALDLINGRISLGAARLIYAGLIVVAISVGLLLGLGLLGVSLPTDPLAETSPVARRHCRRRCRCRIQRVFFNAAQYVAWPVGVGMFAHALRWAGITQFGVGVATGALVAWVAVALALIPVARRTHMRLPPSALPPWCR
jgi:uncharacterized membrane protein YjjB (DUF3815 family)